MGDMEQQESEALGQLCKQFADNIIQYKSALYDEANTRVDFIDKFFEMLGWDVRNTQGYSEHYREVVREDKVVIQGKPKAPDYSFRIGGLRKFFVEAKKPIINIKDDVVPAYQVRRYGYTAKLSLSILTDFEEFSVYDTRIKPAKGDSAAVGRLFYCTFDQYAEKWDFLKGTFSKEAILKGSFDRYAQETKIKKGTSDIDRDFLALISTWREDLAKNLALRNPGLDVYGLNAAVQKIIDRIIFLRIAEDRGTEDYGLLRDKTKSENAYYELNGLFLLAQQKYNSELFRVDPSVSQLAVDNKVLRDMVGALYYPDCPYEFSVFPLEVLGNIYEQFLGKTIRLTAGHQAKVEEKPEVRKAGGVFYTPQYIVRYIVQETLGPLFDGKTPEAAGALRVVDPACGSGSFLIGAYSWILTWYLDHYTQEKTLKAVLKQEKIYQVRDGEYRLTIRENQRLLLEHIWGVDIDPQAVEVTKLSLLLKLMEDEGLESASQNSLFKSSDFRFLPSLDANVVCGNSLVGPDYYDDKNLSLFDVDALRAVNAHDWKKAFPKVFAAGGFDAVVGNPPYVRQEILGAEFKAYAQRAFTTYAGTADLYTYFIERGMGLLKTGGRFGYIVANKWMRANYGKELRRWLAQQGIDEIMDFGDLPVFQDATTYPCILRLIKGEPQETFHGVNVPSLDFADLGEWAKANRFPVRRDLLSGDGWNLTDETTARLLRKLLSTGTPLGDYVEGKIYRGVLTGLNEAFVVDTATRDSLVAEDPRSAELLKPFLAGRDVKRYEPLASDKWVIAIHKGWTNQQSGAVRNKWNWFQENYPALAKRLAPFEVQGKARFDQGDYWWELRACDYYAEFERPKILWPEIAQSARFTFDAENFYFNNKAYMIMSDDFALLGILNSQLLKFVIHHSCTDLQGDSFNFSAVFVQKAPIVFVENIWAIIRELAQERLNVARLAHQGPIHDKALLQQKADLLDRRIDAEVYRLFGLTEEEVRVVEGG